MVETNRTSVELQVPSEEDLLVQIKALSDGGDGSSSSPILIPKMSSKNLTERIKNIVLRQFEAFWLHFKHMT